MVNDEALKLQWHTAIFFCNHTFPIKAHTSKQIPENIPCGVFFQTLYLILFLVYKRNRMKATTRKVNLKKRRNENKFHLHINCDWRVYSMCRREEIPNICKRFKLSKVWCLMKRIEIEVFILYFYFHNENVESENEMFGQIWQVINENWEKEIKSSLANLHTCFSPNEYFFIFHIRETQINPGESKQASKEEVEQIIKSFWKLSRFRMMKGSEREAINQAYTMEGFF